MPGEGDDLRRNVAASRKTHHGRCRRSEFRHTQAYFAACRPYRKHRDPGCEWKTAVNQQPDLPEDLVESLIARCVEAGEAGYRQRLEQICSENPEAGQELRERIGQLEQLGFLGTPPAGAEAAWVPDRIGRYRLTGLLGQGGMGVVFRGVVVDSDQEVAVKLVRPDLLADARARERFRRETLLAARLSHPGICPVLEIGIDHDMPFLVMPLLHGRTLRALLRDPVVERDRVLDWIEAAARALHAAHEAGLVHRDVSPSNLFVTDDGRLVLFDFGLARDMRGEFDTVTRSHEQLGTLPYMAPEQLAGAARIDGRADLYSLGVVLYEALARRLPFVSESRSELSRMILAGESTRLRRLVRDLPRCLELVVHKAIDPDRAQRYSDAAAFADDLHRCREGRQVRARRLGFGVRSRRWVRHHPVAATALSLLSTMLVMAGALVAREQSARQDAEHYSAQLAAKVNEFDQLKGVVLLERAVQNEARLYPAWPANIEAMDRWLKEDCGRLLAMQPSIEQTVRDMEMRAKPLTPEQQEVDRTSHPQFADWEALSQQVTSLRYAQSIRNGAPLVIPELTPQQEAQDALTLNQWAWQLVAPKAEGRKVWAEEPLGLAAARLAVQRAKDTNLEYKVRNTLAWALLANGQDADARLQSELALALAPTEWKQQYEGYQKAVVKAATESVACLRAAEADLARLSGIVGARRTWTLELESQQLLHDTLATLQERLRSLATKEAVAVERRLSWARRIGELTMHHPNARHTWASVREAIAKADGVVANQLYGRKSIALHDEDVIGLVPIGMNPATKLWEFYELRSAWDGMSDPATIAIPAHQADGSIEVTGATGIVLVLLPGGTVMLGSQGEDERAPYYDSSRQPDEVLHTVMLSPFFLARHELTQGQWSRLWTWDAEQQHPSVYKADDIVALELMTLANPVEHVDWPMCDTLLTRHGMVLPTEAQWEYACRGGTTTPWSTGFEELGRVANLASAEATSVTGWACESWRDGHIAHAPVGSHAANGFGLYDMHGNVWEWCRDWYGIYGTERHGDGLRAGRPYEVRCARGGSYLNLAVNARCAYRDNRAPLGRNNAIGLRPARALVP